MSDYFIDNFYHWRPLIDDRIKELRKENKYIEIIFWQALIIESLSTILLSKYENLIIEIFINKKGHLLNKYTARTTDQIRKSGRSFGNINNELSKFLGKDHELIKKTYKFIKIRNTVVHKIFDDNNNPEKLDNLLKKQFLKINKLFLTIENQQLNILNNLYKYTTRILIRRTKRLIKKVKNGSQIKNPRNP